MIALQLHPSYPVVTPKGKGRAIVLIDYSEDHYAFFLCAIDSTGECWIFPHKDIRFQANFTLGTTCCTQTNGILLQWLAGVVNMQTTMAIRLGEMLRSWRTESQLTLKELARKIGVHQSVLSRFERGLQTPDGETLAKIVRFTLDPVES